MTDVNDEDLADLSPNMRLVLSDCDGISIGHRDTYWITLQALATRGLLSRQTTLNGRYQITALGSAYIKALKTWGQRK